MLRRRFLIALFLIAVFWFAGSGYAAFRATHRRHSQRVETLPTEPVFETLRLSTRDGEELGAWFVPGDGDRPIAILLHGISANRSDVVEPARLFGEQGCGQLLLTQRCHGDSTGSYCDFGYSNRHDLVAAVDWIEAHHPNRKIVVWGTSMGAATACFAAEELGPRVSGYFLDSCYADIDIAARNRTRNHLPPGIEWLAYCSLKMWSPIFLPDAERIAPAKATFPESAAVTVATGGLDFKATSAEAAAIAAGIGPRAKLVVFEKGEHSHLISSDPDRYRAEIAELLERAGRR